MEYLKTLRKKAGVSQQCVADYLGITRQAYSNYENGNRAPDNETLLKLAEYFETTTDALLRGSGFLPSLTAKDERDIEKRLEEILDDLEGEQSGIAFSGEALDDETRELLAKSLRNSLEIGKALAKQKYTPKKFRKD